MKKPRVMALLALLTFSGVGYFGVRPFVDIKPDVTFTTLKGAKIDLKALRGSPVLVAFWASDCGVCMQEMPLLSSLHEQFSTSGLQLVGVAMDYDIPRQVVEAVEAKRLPFPVAYDLQGRYAKAFGGVRWVPDSFLLGPDGDIVLHWQGLPDLPLLRTTIGQLLNKKARHVA
ncbi:MAG: peroxiredoxin family protein [Candidatus Methylumidiphilus sp.]